MWKNKELIEFYNHKFDFDNQAKDTYEDWMKAFDESVRKRAVDGCFIGLSSGYDSGAVAFEMFRQGVKFKAFSVRNNENEEIINKRIDLFSDHIPIHDSSRMDKPIFDRHYNFLKGKINKVALRDNASMGVSAMFEAAAASGNKVCISGQGGDEIHSDYSLFPKQSHFKGKWPDKLYEWPNFRGYMQKEYLNELEDIAAVYGIEMRYPFLDIKLVQEFLWLSAELKNRNYKAPIREYLIRYNVPFDENVKRGFNPI
jgi:asparagine synthetase B (glutamine-hydrolysing)